ncbi:MAG: hypothetical protein ABW277_16625, partial [Longimicrobiaceae bacterium]
MSEAVTEVAAGVHRIAVPLPFPPHEVAAWLIEGDDGFTLVDTGMDTPTARGAAAGGAAGGGGGARAPGAGRRGQRPQHEPQR